MAHILLIEDDRKLALVLRKGLQENQYTVDLSHDGREGLEIAMARPYDALVVDGMLPGMDGFALIQELRRQRQLVPVLMLTARSAVEDRVRGIELGADDYLIKPFDFRELLARLRGILRRPPVTTEEVLRLADLELEPRQHLVRRGGNPIDLTPLEFQLLEYLLRNKGHVVTRDMILNRVWDFDYDGGSNVVDVYINYLRRKLDADAPTKLIHTVRGVGYVLRENP